MKERGTWLVPTIYVLNHVIDEGASYRYREESLRKGRALREERDRPHPGCVRRRGQGGIRIR